MFQTLIADQLRLLAFRRPSHAIASSRTAYLAWGLAITWLVGIGRYWDNPKAHLWQHLGLGSLAYIVLLAGLLWLLYLPMRPKRWSYANVLVFLGLCSLPALLYAIPVERFMPLEAAQATNAWFLAVVASWRVALLAVFLRRVADLEWTTVCVATLLPLALIIVALSMLNLEHVVFHIMAGTDPAQRSVNDIAYQVVWLLSVFSFLALPLLLPAYGVMVWQERKRRGLEGAGGRGLLAAAAAPDRIDQPGRTDAGAQEAEQAEQGQAHQGGAAGDGHHDR